MKVWLPGFAITCLLATLAAPVSAQDSVGSLLQEQEQADIKRRAVLQRMQIVQQELAAKDARFKRASDALAETESSISLRTRELKEISESLMSSQTALSEIAHQMTVLEQDLAVDRLTLANQLRAQYSSGLSPWSALLSGRDPQTLGRELGYLSYVARARAQTIEQLRQRVSELSVLQRRQTDLQDQLALQQQDLKRKTASLEQQRQARRELLAQLEEAIVAERAEHDRLVQDEKRLAQLIEGLGREIEQSKQNQVQSKREKVLTGLPQSDRIKRGMPKPITGTIKARFASERPDGGDWRGVLIAAPTGSAVKAVADGVVVYGKWLRGFGNLIIVDHSEGFLTVYAYNESLLKDVGQTVIAGEEIARAGNTGGQLDSALYFEIRHQGTPLDPMLYFER
jgi:murein hydrolase activator